MRKPETVVLDVCAALEVGTGELLSSSREDRIVLARRTIIALLRKHCEHRGRPLSYPRIAALMGRRSHSGVHEAYKFRDTDDVRDAIAKVEQRWEDAA